MQLKVEELFSTKRQQVHALQEGLPFSEVIFFPARSLLFQPAI